MPKTKVVTRPTSPPEDVPIWDALLTEFGDPRPYEPVTIPSSYVVPDAPLAAELDDVAVALVEVDRDVTAAHAVIGDVVATATALLDAAFPLDEVDDALERRAWRRHAKVRTQQTIVIPIWPGVDVEEVVP